MITNDKCWLKNECNRCDCDGFCLRLFKLDYLYDQALIKLPQRKRQDFYGDVEEKFDDTPSFDVLAHITKNVEAFVEEGCNIYIHSAMTGNGKTSWALRIVQEYLNKIWYKSELKCRALFISVPKLLIALKNDIDDNDEYAQHIKENVLDADIVIWDDIATKTITTFEAEHLFSMIDARICAGKSNIFTSNLNDDELIKALGERLASRVSNCDYNLEFKGKDKRGIKIK